MKVEEKEFETVENTVERYKCDHCGVVKDKCEIDTVALINGTPPDRVCLRDRAIEIKHLCTGENGCSNVRQALQIREERNHVQERWEAFGKGFSTVFTIGSKYFIILLLAFATGAGAVWVAGNLSPREGMNPLVMVNFLVGTILSFAIVLTCFLAMIWLIAEAYD